MLREQCIKSGISEADFDKVDQTLVKSQVDELVFNELTQLLKIWRLHKPTEWDYLFLIQAHYLEEMKLLNNARTKLRKGFRRIYSAYLTEAKNLKARAHHRKDAAGNEKSKG